MFFDELGRWVPVTQQVLCRVLGLVIGATSRQRVSYPICFCLAAGCIARAPALSWAPTVGPGPCWRSAKGGWAYDYRGDLAATSRPARAPRYPNTNYCCTALNDSHCIAEGRGCSRKTAFRKLTLLVVVRFFRRVRLAAFSKPVIGKFVESICQVLGYLLFSLTS